MKQLTAWTLLLASTLPGSALEPVPDKLVVLTFDDSVASHYSNVRPLLKKLGFGATFFITEGFTFPTNKRDYLTWDQIAEMHREGFEIGNHTRDHLGISAETLGRLREQIEVINAHCVEHGIPRTTSFAWPGNAIHPGALPILRELGIRFARRGGSPEHPYEWGRGYAYEPGVDDPLLVPSAGDARPDWVLDDFRRAVDQARDGRVAVLQFHGVPDREHPWVNTSPERFSEFMQYLKTNGCRVVALRELERYASSDAAPADPLAVIERRKAARIETSVEGEVRDAKSGGLLPARVYIRGENGAWYFPKSTSLAGAALRYERRNGSNTNSVEMHTAVSAHPFRVELTPGRYTVTVERGKEWFSESRSIDVGREPVKFVMKLGRWINLAERGWYSGDTHVHRDPVELGAPMLAEDVNVVLPMTDWTTASLVPPDASEHSLKAAFKPVPVYLDPTHVWYPRNTEYEIFRTGDRDHMLGALLIVNHTNRLDVPVFPLREVARRARAEGALLDLEKHNWPWSLALVPLLKVDLFELANNHHWETEYAVRSWAVPAPAWMGLKGTGTDNEHDWTLYGLQTWYALLDCGFNLRPTAGTAHGVHPVPLGFSRVYVHLDGGFSYEAWMRGLSAGRSFVTTGPMLFATANRQDPGAHFSSKGLVQLRVEGEVHAAKPIRAIEFVANGEVIRSIPGGAAPGPGGDVLVGFSESFEFGGSAWLAVRCWEERENGRLRFAHTAPWHVDVAGAPLRPRQAEAQWCWERVRDEIDRNRGVVPEAGIREFEEALASWQDIVRTARSDAR